MTNCCTELDKQQRRRPNISDYPAIKIIEWLLNLVLSKKFFIFPIYIFSKKTFSNHTY